MKKLVYIITHADKTKHRTLGNFVEDIYGSTNKFRIAATKLTKNYGDFELFKSHQFDNGNLLDGCNNVGTSEADYYILLEDNVLFELSLSNQVPMVTAHHSVTLLPTNTNNNSYENVYSGPIYELTFPEINYSVVNCVTKKDKVQ